MSDLAVRSQRLRAAKARAGRFDGTILIWLTLAALLAFIVVNPLLRLVLSSFEQMAGPGVTRLPIT